MNLGSAGRRTTDCVRYVKVWCADWLTCCRTSMPCLWENFVAAQPSSSKFRQLYTTHRIYVGCMSTIFRCLLVDVTNRRDLVLFPSARTMRWTNRVFKQCLFLCFLVWVCAHAGVVRLGAGLTQPQSSKNWWLAHSLAIVSQQLLRTVSLFAQCFYSNTWPYTQMENEFKI